MDIKSFFSQYIKDHSAPEVTEPKTPVKEPHYCARCRDLMSENQEVRAEGDICEICKAEEARGYQIMQLLGRLRNGAARDHGILNHAVKLGEWKAVCGAQPGRRSVGWVRAYDLEEGVTCPRCIKRMDLL